MITVHNAAELDISAYADIQQLQYSALVAALPEREPEEIASFVALNDPDRYATSHQDPNTEVGRRFINSQEYWDPKIAIARKTEEGEVVGFAYTANNISGSGLVRMVKKITRPPYLWLREAVVAPEHQQSGVARLLIRTLLEQAIPEQPIATYIVPKEAPFILATLERYGFRATGETPKQPYGQDGPTVTQIRMQADSVKSVLSLLH